MISKLSQFIPDDDNTPLLISFSGGRTSAKMTKHLVDKYRCSKREFVVGFANTGREREETLQFVNECDKRWKLNVVWVEAVTNPRGIGTTFRIVDFESANRDGRVFEEMIAKFGIPNKPSPHCSRELKTVPLEKLCRSLGWKKWNTAIGIRMDELHRIKNMRKALNAGKRYPLIFDIPSNKESIMRWWANQPFDLQLRPLEGNCNLCWKKTKRKLLTLLVERPNDAEWWLEMENRYSMFQPERINRGGGDRAEPPYYFYRDNTSILELIEDSKMPFDKWEELNEIQMAMFSDPELDYTDGCETCEAF